MGSPYGQHFLSNRHAAERIGQAVDAKPGDAILEIGPGKGALTPFLLSAGRLVVVDVDERMVRFLQQRFAAANPNLTILHRDILTLDMNSLAAAVPFKVVGNLPYNLTSPILRKLSEWTGWATAVVMVQKEVGDRLVASVGTAAYGALTVGMSLTCVAEKIFELSPQSFDPPPKVKSVVLRLRRREKPLTDSISSVQRVIQAAFQQRRKTIENSLSHGLGIEKEAVRTRLHALNLDPLLRAERLTVEDFIRLATALRT